MRRPPGLHEGQRLQRLEGRAGEGSPVGVAGLGQHGAGAVDDGDGAEMQALGCAAAAEFDQGYEVHFRILPVPWRFATPTGRCPVLDPTQPRTCRKMRR